MIYYFYSKTDSFKEPVLRAKCQSYEDALNYFSKIKKLSKQEFIKLYEITNENDSKL